MNRLPAIKKVSPAPPGSPPELQVQSQFSEGELANFRRVFDHYDTDGSGDIDCVELEAAFTSLNNGNPPPMGMIDDFMRRLDKDGGGAIEFPEFLTVILELRQPNSETKKTSFLSRFLGLEPKKDLVVERGWVDGLEENVEFKSAPKPKPKKLISSAGGDDKDGRHLRSPYKVSAKAGSHDVVEFQRVEYLVYENEGSVELTIIRRGPSKNRIDLNYSNIDINVGSSFLPTAGRVCLFPGETEKTFKINFNYVKDVFNTEALMDFELTFADPNIAAKVAFLGDLQRTRVVILNNDLFPNGVDLTGGDGVEDLSDSFGVIMGFINHNYMLFKTKSKWALLYKLAPGINFVVNQIIQRNLIDVLYDGYQANLEHNKRKVEALYPALIWLAIATYMNFQIGFWADDAYNKLKIGGASIKAMRMLVMDTVNQLTPQGEQRYDVARVMKIADVQCNEAIRMSFTSIFSLFQSIFQIGIMITYIMYVVYNVLATGTVEDPAYVSILLIAAPTVMGIMDAALLVISIKPVLDKSLEAMEEDDAWSSFMAQATFVRQTITTFRKGFAVTENFSQIHQQYNKANYIAGRYKLQTKWRANMFPQMTAAVSMVMIGDLVLRGQLTVAQYIPLIGTLYSFGPTLAAGFMDCFNIVQGLASIKNISFLLNQETRRKQLLRCQKLHEILVEDFKRNPPAGMKWDPDALIVHDVTYNFHPKETSMVPPITFSLDGGQTVCLRGEGSIGKNLLLRLIARHFVPTTGFVSYPPRWRYRFLDAAPSFFGGDPSTLARIKAEHGLAAYHEARKRSQGTLDYNVKFGAQFKHPDHKVWDKEIFNLLRALGMSGELIGEDAKAYSEGVHAKKYTMIGLNGDKMSLTNRALLAIARCLLSSPDLILVSNTFDLLGPTRAVQVLMLLNEYTKERAISVLATEAAANPKNLRKKKTVIFSTKIPDVEDMADNWLKLEDEVEVATMSEANVLSAGIMSPDEGFMI